MKRDAFVAGGLRIETARDWDARWFVCWKPHVSIHCRSRKEVLKFAAWPVKTPTGDSLRSWLDSLEQMDQERVTKKEKAEDPALSPELLATGWGPEVHLATEAEPIDNDIDNDIDTRLGIFFGV